MNPEYNRRTQVARQFAAEWLATHSYSTQDAANTEYAVAADAMRNALDALNGRPSVNEHSRNVIFDNISDSLSFVHRLGPISADQLANAAINAALSNGQAHVV